MNRTGLLFVCLMAVATSCISINGSGYDSLSREERQRVVRCEQAIESLKHNDSIYQVSAVQVREYVERNDKVLIYEYLPFCSSKNCISPMAAEQWCKERNITLCVIATTYDDLFRSAAVSVPLLAIDISRYSTDNYQKYGRLFFDELTGTSNAERGYGHFHLFDKGKYIKTEDNINSLTP